MFGSNRLSVVSQVVEADQMTSVVPISLEVSHLSHRCGRLFGERHQATTTAAPPSPPQHTLPPLTMSSTTRSIIGGTLTSPSPTSSSQATSVDGKKWRCVQMFSQSQQHILAWQGSSSPVGKELLSSKSDLVLWISSHCSTNSKREE